MVQTLLIVGGLIGALAVLVWTAQKTVDRLTDLARNFDIPDALIAMSVVAIGTSLPEISSHIMASVGILSGTLDPKTTSFTIIGGNMGSSTVQQILFLGILFLGSGKKTYEKRFFLDTYLPMLLSFVLLFFLSLDQTISRTDGAIMLIGFFFYMILSYRYRPRSIEIAPTERKPYLTDLLLSIAGFVVVVVSASLCLKFVEMLVERLNLNGSMAGMISIGFAAALPEFSTVVESLRRNNPYLALGTLIGSNVVNPLMGIGLGAAISSYHVPPSLFLWDLPFKFIVGLILLIIVTVIRKHQAGRAEGLFLVISYFLYLSVRMMFFS